MDVFQPIERERFEGAIRGGRTALERDRYALGLVDPAERQEVYLRVVDGEHYVCPTQTRLRALLALLELERSLPRLALDVFFSSEEVEEARLEVATLTVTHPHTHVLQSAWHVPVRWFACFDDSDRQLTHDGDHPTIRYETRVAPAQERISRALETVQRGIVHPAVVGMVHELHEWLQAFDGRALLELDYASVSKLFEADDLADDHSAADVHHAIEALAAGDGLRAGQFYQRVNERWAPCRARESLN
jgi:hypothetical protein